MTEFHIFLNAPDHYIPSVIFWYWIIFVVVFTILFNFLWKTLIGFIKQFLIWATPHLASRMERRTSLSNFTTGFEENLSSQPFQKNPPGGGPLWRDIKAEAPGTGSRECQCQCQSIMNKPPATFYCFAPRMLAVSDSWGRKCTFLSARTGPRTEHLLTPLEDPMKKLAWNLSSQSGSPMVDKIIPQHTIYKYISL